MHKPKLYIETSAWNFLLADDSPEKKAITERFFSEVANGTFDVHISPIVRDEINNTREQTKRQKLNELLKHYKPVEIPITTEAINLAQRYIDEELLPEAYRDDAIHLAIASVADMEVVVTWNMEHMAKLKTRRGVPAVNALLGYRLIDIATPEEMIDYVS